LGSSLEVLIAGFFYCVMLAKPGVLPLAEVVCTDTSALRPMGVGLKGAKSLSPQLKSKSATFSRPAPLSGQAIFDGFPGT